MDVIRGIHFHVSEPVNARVNAFTRWFSAIMSFRY